MAWWKSAISSLLLHRPARDSQLVISRRSGLENGAPSPGVRWVGPSECRPWESTKSSRWNVAKHHGAGLAQRGSTSTRAWVAVSRRAHWDFTSIVQWKKRPSVLTLPIKTLMGKVFRFRGTWGWFCTCLRCDGDVGGNGVLSIFLAHLVLNE